jgi:hypothetical protein
MKRELGGIYASVSSSKAHPRFYVCMDYQEIANVGLFVDELQSRSDVYGWHSMRHANLHKLFEFQMRNLLMRVFGDNSRLVNSNSLRPST